MDRSNINYKSYFDKILKEIKPLEGNDNNKVSKEYKVIVDEIEKIRNGCQNLFEGNKVLRIGVVGQVKAGKSSFLNSLFFNGENVLPRASTPMTAGLTILEYGEKNSFDVEFYNNKEWKYFEDKAQEFDLIIKECKQENPDLTDKDIIDSIEIDQSLVAAKELVSSCKKSILSNIQDNSKIERKEYEDINNLQDILEEYVGVNGSYTPIVKCLTIKINDERLKDIQIVDTPGVNDPIISREMRTREFLRGCHGVFFLSYSGRFFDSIDVSFLVDRIGIEGIGTVVLIASKFDSVLQDVGNQFRDNLSLAISDCKSKLEGQFRSNIKNAGYKGKEPIFDFSSGIGYSIAKKDKTHWDAMESHIVSQMKMYYPSFFDDDQSTKELFEALSKIEEIQDKYVKEIFVDKKDEIIQNKLENYLESNLEGLKNKVLSSKERLVQFKKDMDSSDIKDLESRMKAYEGIVLTFSKDLEALSMQVGNDSSKAVKKILGEFNLDVCVKKEEKSVKVKRERFIWNKSVHCEYEYVNFFKLTDSLKKQYETQINNIGKEWDKEALEIIKRVKNTINKRIAESENADKKGKLDTYILRNILETQFSELGNKMKFEHKGIEVQLRREHEALIKELTDLDYSPKSLYSGDSDDVVQGQVRKEANKAIANIYQTKGMYIDKCETAMSNYLIILSEACPKIVGEDRTKFIAAVKKDLEEYMDSLRNAINDYKSQSVNLEKGIKIITEIYKLI